MVGGLRASNWPDSTSHPALQGGNLTANLKAHTVTWYKRGKKVGPASAPG